MSTENIIKEIAAENLHAWFVGDGLDATAGSCLFAGALLYRTGPLDGDLAAAWTCDHHHRKIQDAIACAEIERLDRVEGQG